MDDISGFEMEGGHQGSGNGGVAEETGREPKERRDSRVQAEVMRF